MQTTESVADGTFRIDLLPAGIYKLKAGSSNDSVIDAYFDNADFGSTATEIVVMGNQVDIGALVLKRAGKISGRISARPGLTYTLRYIDAHRCIENDTEEPTCSFVKSTSMVDAQGTYTLTDLPAGNYSICASFYLLVKFRSSTECWGDNVDDVVEGSTWVTLTLGAYVTGIDLEVGASAGWGLISGQVRNAAGAPIAGITVSEPHHFRGGPTVTDVNGTYTMTAESTDTLYLYFEDSENKHYVDQYYGGVQYRSEATGITIAAGEHRRGIDVTMQVGGRIQGTLMVTKDLPAEQGTVRTVAESGVHSSDVVSTTGFFELSGLPDGVYTLSAWTKFNGTDIAGSYAGGKLITITNAAVISGIDFIVTDELFNGEISGTIMNQDGMPLPNIRATVYKHSTRLVYADTDINGRYGITGLGQGRFYKLGFSDPAGTYATLYHPNQPMLEDALPIRITSTETTYEMNATLATASTPTSLFLPIVTR